MSQQQLHTVGFPALGMHRLEPARPHELRQNARVLSIIVENRRAVGVALAEPGTRPFDMTGRPMKGWIVVDASMCAEDDDLRRWVSRGVAHARAMW